MAIIEEVVENSDITETVEKLKQEGNTSFGQGEWSAAAEKYKVCCFLSVRICAVSL